MIQDVIQPVGIDASSLCFTLADPSEFHFEFADLKVYKSLQKFTKVYKSLVDYFCLSAVEPESSREALRMRRNLPNLPVSTGCSLELLIVSVNNLLDKFPLINFQNNRSGNAAVML